MKKFLNSRWGILTLIIAGIVIIYLFQRIGAWQFAKNSATSAFSPVQSFFSQSATKVKDFFVYFEDIQQIKKENEDLKLQLSILQQENLSLKAQIENNDVLAQELEFASRFSFNTVSAKKIGHSSDQYSQLIIINKGQRDGLEVGLPVIAMDGIIVGKIIEANQSVSKVLLLSDTHSEISAVIQNPEKSQGIISGQYGINLRMKLIPHDDNIDSGQIVATSGIEDFIPADLVIGTINLVDRKEGELFQQADVVPSITYQNLNILTVILPIND